MNKVHYGKRVNALATMDSGAIGERRSIRQDVKTGRC